MRHLLVTLVLTLAAGLAQATQIPSYLAQVDLTEQELSQLQLEVQITDAVPGTLLIPLASGFAPAGPILTQSAPLGTQVKAITVGERPHLEIKLPDGVAASFALKLGFPLKTPIVAPKKGDRGKNALPPDSLRLDHAFVNTQPIAIGSYRLKLALPEQTRVHRVVEQSPRTRRNELEPRVALNGADGRQGAVLQVSGLKIGDRTSMALELVEDHRSWTWLLVGLALAAGYLYGFRHLVARPRT